MKETTKYLIPTELILLNFNTINDFLSMFHLFMGILLQQDISLLPIYSCQDGLGNFFFSE